MQPGLPLTGDSRSLLFDRAPADILYAAARVFATEGDRANLASVAAGRGRLTLYRYYENRDAMPDALTADSGLARRLADAGLQRGSVHDAVERIVLALVSVGDSYAVMLSDHAKVRAAIEQLAVPVHDVLARGIDSGALRDDRPIGMLNEFLTWATLSAVKLTRNRRLGVEASGAAASLSLGGSRPRTPSGDGKSLDWAWRADLQVRPVRRRTGPTGAP